jgi:DNA (cytosine-5)-methyltransferase 1
MRKPACNPGSRVRYRANIKLGNEKDKELHSFISDKPDNQQLYGVLKQSRSELRVVELFAGAGGMGLGFLMAGNQQHGFKIIQSAEIEPIYLKSLEKNYKYFAQHSSNALDDCYPSDFQPIDLTKDYGRRNVHEAVQRAGGVDVLIGGTPCQGFSQSNRSSWNPENPYNKLVDIFVQCAVELTPKVILLENVQGILWTPRTSRSKNKKLTVIDYISKKLTNAGYVLFPAVLDAAWYGVPQHRNRFFLLGLHKNLGYKTNDFGEWGAFPVPTHGALGQYKYVTVRDAIADLPIVENGENKVFQDYDEPTEEQLKFNSFLRQMREMSPRGVIEGHIVSRQADYVIERYSFIPQGGNWQNIRHLMDNYADIERTHSNIYRRLKWDEPSITIGNYRKSMIVHPEQNRGLSLREATRLQSLPDWFTFCNSTDDSKVGGIGHKQQQLANAVSFLLTLSIAKYILKL